MRLDQIENNLKSINDFNKSFTYSLNEKATEFDFIQIEKKLNLKIPDKVKMFYKFSDGLITINPNLKIFELSGWKRIDKHLIHFATFNDLNEVYFDTKKLNVAEQWSIINRNGYTLTYTMSSFWSNKIWHWLRFERIIWEDKYWEKTIG